MKLFRNVLLIAFAAMTATTEPVAAVIDNPITQAVIAVYDKQLRENPNDYMTWFRRANEYYRHSEYVRALDDVDHALACAPTGDTDLRFQAYMLRAGIYNQTGKHEQALADLNSAVSLDGSSYAALYQRANTQFELGNYGPARADYTRLQRFNSRSSEALLGLARCSVKENNLPVATDYLEQAVNLDPNNGEIYIRRANVRRMMGDHNGAVDDLILAISLNAKDPKAIQTLVDYGNTNYTATMTGLTNAIKLAPENGLYRYLRASIAEAHFNYISAIDDFEKIINDRLYSYHGLYASLARCLYGLGRYDEALAQIDTALGQESNVADYFVLRSKILRALNRSDEAIQAAARGLAVDGSYVPGLVEMALNYIDQGNFKEANSLLGEAGMADALDPSVLLLRSSVLSEKLNQPVAARGFSEQVLEIDNLDPDNVRSLRGFALLDLGRTDEADAWMEHILQGPDYDGLVNYYAACYYTLRDNPDRALECVENSLKAGYSDNHNWMNNNDGRINVSYLRDDLRFLQLMQRYNSIFGK